MFTLTCWRIYKHIHCGRAFISMLTTSLCKYGKWRKKENCVTWILLNWVKSTNSYAISCIFVFLTILTIFDNLNIWLTILTSFWQFWPFLQLFTILTILTFFWQFLQFLTIFDDYGNFDILWPICQFLPNLACLDFIFLQFWTYTKISTKTIIEPCDIWDTDYNIG